MEGGEEIPRGLIVARSDGAELFEFAKEIRGHLRQQRIGGGEIMSLSRGQQEAHRIAVNSILKILFAKTMKIALCAPTGRAAKRLSASAGLGAKTIHRLLGADPRTGSFRLDEEAPLDCDLLVVDKTSMVDVPPMRAVLRAVRETPALLLIGDVDQLPSVGPGQVRAQLPGRRCAADVSTPRPY